MYGRGRRWRFDPRVWAWRIPQGRALAVRCSHSLWPQNMTYILTLSLSRLICKNHCSFSIIHVSVRFMFSRYRKYLKHLPKIWSCYSLWTVILTLLKSWSPPLQWRPYRYADSHFSHFSSGLPQECPAPAMSSWHHSVVSLWRTQRTF